MIGEDSDPLARLIDDAEATSATVADILAKRVPRGLGIPPRDIKVATPMHYYRPAR